MNYFLIFLLILTCMSRVYIQCRKYLFYDVFYGEGFNLRRDVYIRVANTLRLMRDPSQIPDFALKNIQIKNLTGDDWILVLPPWGPLPHWFNDRLYKKYTGYNAYNWSGVSWSMYFDLNSLSVFVPVMDLIEYQRNVLNSMPLNKLSNTLTIDLALQLVRETFDKVKQYSHTDRRVDYCPSEIRELYASNNSLSNRPMELFEGSSFTSKSGILPMTASAYDCITGDLEPVHLAPFLIRLIENYEKPIMTLYLGSAQSIIHGHWSEWSQEYWTVRRSMTVASHLRDIGDNYRAAYLQSFDTVDRTVLPLMIENFGSGSGWLRSQWPLSPALGGPYIAVHWRRGDFVTTSDTDSVTSTTRSSNNFVAAEQILNALRIFNQNEDRHIDTIYLATDANQEEVENLKNLLYPFQVLNFEPSESQWISYGPGGIAIIDQWICAHARYFIGTSLSTFTFRIVEERSIIGFLANTTFNNLCPNGVIHLYRATNHLTVQTSRSLNCETLTDWPVIYEKKYTVTSILSSAEDEMYLHHTMKDEL